MACLLLFSFSLCGVLMATFTSWRLTNALEGDKELVIGQAGLVLTTATPLFSSKRGRMCRRMTDG